MKRIFLLFFLCALCIDAVAAELPEELEEYVPKELYEDALESEDPTGHGFAVLWESLRGEVRDAFGTSLRSAAKLLLLTLLCGVLEGAGSALSAAAKLYIPYFTVLCAASLCTGDLTMLIGLGTETVGELSVLSKSLLPTVAMAMAAGGNITTASVWQTGTLMACDLLLTLIQNLLLPLLYCYIGISAAEAILPESGLDKLAQGLKKLISLALCGAAVAFTAYLTLSNALSGTADRMSVKASKLVISNAIPVVGGILSEASEAVLSGAGALRGTVGMLGIFAVLSICLLPLLRLGIEYLLYQTAALLSALSGVKALQSFMEQLSGAFSLLLAMTGCAALFLLAALLAAITMVTAV